MEISFLRDWLWQKLDFGGAYMWKHVGCAHLFALLLCGGTGLDSVTLVSTGPVQETDALVVSVDLWSSLPADENEALFSQTCHLSKAFPRLDCTDWFWQLESTRFSKNSRTCIHAHFLKAGILGALLCVLISFTAAFCTPGCPSWKCLHLMIDDSAQPFEWCWVSLSIGDIATFLRTHHTQGVKTLQIGYCFALTQDIIYVCHCFIWRAGQQRWALYLASTWKKSNTSNSSLPGRCSSQGNLIQRS